MDTVVALLPSPLLGPSTWRRVGDELVRHGLPVLTVAPTASPRTADDVLDAFVDALPDDRPLLLVPHSNAGLFVPALTALRDVAGYLFVDAGLPIPAGDVPLAPPAFYRFLTGLAGDDGMLPPWTTWWDPAEVASLLPTPEVRERVEREQRRLPLSYFRGSLTAPPGWDRRPGAYLAFGETYADDREAAAGRGWPVATMTGGHLHTVVDPGRVATRIRALISEMAIA